jgi:hypothetical protein
MHTKWQLPLLEAMFVKYTAIVICKGNEDKGDDENGDKSIITIKQVAIEQSISIFILRRQVDLAPRKVAVFSLQTPQQRIVQRKLKAAQKEHSLAVRRVDL